MKYRVETRSVSVEEVLVSHRVVISVEASAVTEQRVGEACQRPPASLEAQAADVEGDLLVRPSSPWSVDRQWRRRDPSTVSGGPSTVSAAADVSDSSSSTTEIRAAWSTSPAARLRLPSGAPDSTDAIWQSAGRVHDLLHSALNDHLRHNNFVRKRVSQLGSISSILHRPERVL